MSAPATAHPVVSPLYAAVDMGSNSLRLELGGFDAEGRYRMVDYLKDVVRLGAAIDEQGHLGGPAIAQMLACLQRFRARLAAEPGIRLRAVATQSLREARNGADIAAQASLALGHPVEVIDGQEEARLAWLGVASLQPGHRRRLVMDVGGRSSELVLGHGARLERAFSLPVGSVSLSRRHFAEGCFSASAFEAATAAAQAAVAPTALALGAWPRWEEALGSSGTVSAVSRVLGANGMAGPDGAVSLGALAWCRQQCEAAGEAQALHLAGLEQDRRPVMGGSIALLTGLFQALGLEAVRPARGALRNGVIFDLAQHPAA